MDSFILYPAPYRGEFRHLEAILWASTFDHINHTGLPSVEPGHTGPPGCGPHAGGRASNSYLHVLAYKQIYFKVLIVLKNK